MFGLKTGWWGVSGFPITGVEPSSTANPIKLETGSRPNSAGIPYTLLLRIEAAGFPTFRLLLQGMATIPPVLPTRRSMT